MIFNQLAISSNEKPKIRTKIFIVASYDNNHPCSKLQIRGIVDNLSYDSYDFRIYYLNSLNIPTYNPTFLCNVKTALKHISQFNPDILITIDDNAFRYIGTKYIGRIPVYFSGLNADPNSYQYNDNTLVFNSNTDYNKIRLGGIFEKFDILYAFNLLRYVNVPHDVVVLYDNTSTSIMRKEEIENLSSKYRFLTFKYVNIKNTNELLDWLYNNKSKDIILLSLLRSIFGRYGSLSIIEIYDYLLNYDHKYTIYSYNKYLICNYCGLGTAMDFYKMGEYISTLLKEGKFEVNTDGFSGIPYYNAKLCPLKLPINVMRKFKQCIN